MCRRQSVSLPGFHEGLNSGKLVSRLSLVGDELEESLKVNIVFYYTWFLKSYFNKHYVVKRDTLLR